ncbi:MAG: molybdopterin biosynthesis protein [Desulfotomaculales bacterium]
MAKRNVYLEDRPWPEALERWLEHLEAVGALAPGPTEIVAAERAVGRVTAEPVFARLSSPHYHSAAMDGLAVQAAATFGASEVAPLRLRLGAEAFPVDTGDPLPSGCDAVIMIEDVHFVEPGVVEIVAPAVPWQHVRVVGEDIVATEMILPAHHRLRPVDIGGLLAGGVTEVAVLARPRVAVIATGDEVVEPGSALEPGHVVDYNSRVLAALVEEWGGTATRMGIVRDDPEALAAAVRRAVSDHRVVALIAGSSAGREDFTAEVLRSLGNVLVHGVATRPGKPVVLGEVAGRPVMGVPGYPVSAVLAAELFLKPVVFRLQGRVPPARPRTAAVLSRRLVSAMGVEEFVRVKLGQVGEKLIATPLARGAGLITSLIRADGILRIPAAAEGVEAGQRVEVELLRSPEEIAQTVVVIGSHDLALDVLADLLKRKYPEAGLSSAHVGSMAGLLALRRGEAHAAGTHLLDEETGEYNVPYLRRLLPGTPVVLVNLAYREQGLMVRPGNPKGIHDLSDLARPEVRFVNRQKGAGTRVLLDYKLKQLGLSPDQIRGYENEEFTHMAVAVAVASGRADVGLGILAAARALNLEFIPVLQERYDLCFLKAYWDQPVVRRVLDVLNSAEFRERVAAFGGYDLRDCGRVMWEG